MWYQLKITRPENQPDFRYPQTEELYFSRVGQLNGQGILFGHPKFEPRILETTFERCDDPEIVKDAFKGWGQITCEQVKR